MDKKINITVNGQSFEIPVDASLLTGLFGMAQAPKRFSVPVPTSHQRLEDNFFRLLDNETRTNRAIMALHRRLKVLEDRCIPKHIEMPKFPVVDPRILELGMNLVNSLSENVEEPKKSSKSTPTKAKTKAVPKTKGKSTKVVKKKS